MDPNATLKKLLDAIAAGEREETLEALSDLHAWLAKGGFMPEPPAQLLTPHERNTLARILTKFQLDAGNNRNAYVARRILRKVLNTFIPA